MLRTINPWLLVLSAAILAVLSWPPFPFPFLIFLAPVPLLLLEDRHYHVADKPLLFYFQVSVALTLWNAGTTWWTWFASPVGAVLAIVLNAQFQAIPWVLFHRTRKIFGDKMAYPALIAMILSLEYIHFNWDIAWPWLNLGNVFATATWAVRWYSVTGILGGSLWILAVGIALFRLLREDEKRIYAIRAAFLAILPMGISYFMAYEWGRKMAVPPFTGYEVAVVQPNIDPYNEKFEGMSPEEQLQRLFHLTDSVVTAETELVLWPETALIQSMDEDNLAGDPAVQRIQAWVENHPKIMLVTGATTVHYYYPGDKLSATARKAKFDASLHYDVYNAALAFVAGKPQQVYHKARLVPGVEKMPYPFLFGFLEHLAIDLGGTSGSLGSSDSAGVFVHGDMNVAPIICYESVFGEYTGEYLRNGANVLAVITNDGWWKDTPGYRQHFLYAKLRAIENQMPVCRSANTGVSGFIDAEGHTMQETQWWVPGALRASISTAGSPTFYARYGDYIGRISAVIAVIVILAGFVRAKTRRGY